MDHFSLLLKLRDFSVLTNFFSVDIVVKYFKNSRQLHFNGL